MAAEEKKIKKTRRPGKWGLLRAASQGFFLVLFIFLVYVTGRELSHAPVTDIFFHLDPLTAITSMIAGRDLWPPMLLCLVTLGVTFWAGRAWCGWVCPTGTVFDWIPSLRRKPEKAVPSQTWRRQMKNIILFVIMLSAILGSLTLLFLDPVTIFFRTMASVIIPLTNSVVNSSEEWLFQLTFLRPAIEWLDGIARNTILTSQPFYLPSLWIALPFAAILALNIARPRFWCRYLCPLGALLGLVSKISWLKPLVSEDKCVKCSRCANICPTGAISKEKDFKADPAECISCLECVETCPSRAYSFSHAPALPAFEPSRRTFLISAGAAVLGAALLRIPFLAGNRKAFVRPPGSNAERLEGHCIRCGECIKACPTGAIQAENTDFNGFWTPHLVLRKGYCDYGCNACGQVCPTGAITALALEAKRKLVIGRATVDEKRCIPFAEGRQCIVCEEMCPLPQKAISLENISPTLKGPRVDRHLCIGCGICEYQCPLNGQAAIVVAPEAGAIPAGEGQGRGGGRGLR